MNASKEALPLPSGKLIEQKLSASVDSKISIYMNSDDAIKVYILSQRHQVNFLVILFHLNCTQHTE